MATTNDETTAAQVDALVLRFYPQARCVLVPAGHEQRYKVIVTLSYPKLGTRDKLLSGPFHVTEKAAWAAAERKVRDDFREILNGTLRVK